MSFRQLSPRRRHEVHHNVAAISMPNAPFYIMAALSVTIASYGLLANSAAVIIGAMLVAPLMGPIFGIALGLSTGDNLLLARAVFAEALGVLIGVGLAALIGLLPFRMEFGSEILARTQPTLYDMIIALASGLAGAYALVDEKVSATLVGVAVATAIVPPLAACGLCLSAGQWQRAWGAFLLFGANFLSIEVAAAVVFVSLGIVAKDSGKPVPFRSFVKHFSVSIAALLFIGIFLTRTLVSLLSARELSHTLQAKLSSAIQSTLGARLSDIRREKQGNQINVVATVLTPQGFNPDEVDRMEQMLKKTVNPDIHLIIRSLISKDVDRSGPVFLTEAEQNRRVEENKEILLMGQISQSLETRLAKIPGARLVNVRRRLDGGANVISAIVEAPKVITPKQVAQLQTFLSQDTGTPAELIVHTILTRDAAASGYLYEPNPPPKKPVVKHRKK